MSRLAHPSLLWELLLGHRRAYPRVARAVAAPSVPPAPAVPAGRRIAELDGLRGLAVLLVLVWHYGVCCLTTRPGTALDRAVGLLSLTWNGVDLFFVLSGFLIGGILIDARDSSRYFRTFYARRVCRIFPLYYLVIGSFLAGLYLCRHPALHRLAWMFVAPAPLPFYLTYLQNFWMQHVGSPGPHWVGVTWTLAIEEQFYLTLPLLVRLTPRRALAPLVVGLIVLAPALRWLGLAAWGPAAAVHVGSVYRMDSLLFGVLAALVVRDPGLWGALTRRPRLLYAALLVLAAGTVGLALLSGRSGYRHWGWVVVQYTWFGLLYAATVLACLADRQGLVARVCRCRVLVEMGVLSYGLYLFHQPINGTCHSLLFGTTYPNVGTLKGAGATLLSLLLTYLAAKLSWTFLERPLVRVGHRCSY